MNKTPSVKQVARIVEEIAPRALALAGDPVGLQCGEPDQPVRRLMLSLDASPQTAAQAAEHKVDLLLTHHPLLYEPLTTGNISGVAARTLTAAIRGNFAVYSCHTNLDASPEGINAALADLLDLRQRTYLQAAGPEPFKVVVTVPPGDLDTVRSAAFQAGGGRIGDYSRCSFAVEGTGTFRPGQGAEPAVGERGRDERVAEARLELTVGEGELGAVLAGLRAAHPYEEPAIDVYPTSSTAQAGGFGIAGALPGRTTVAQLVSRLRAALKPGSTRLVGKKGAKVTRVALCAGSGASLLEAAIGAGAQLYITGDIKYHEARLAEDAGIGLLDVGHFAPERFGLVRFGQHLEKSFAREGFAVEISYAKEKDPFVSLD